jgi:long-chain fatty acid transport protein
MKRRAGAVFVFVLLHTTLLSPRSLFAVGSSGFENASYSAKTLAEGNAVVARPQDPSTVSFNPAGLTELPGVQFNLGSQLYDFRVFHRNQVTGDHNQSNGKVLVIPTLALSANPGKLLDDRFAFGLAVNSPFGLSTSFPTIGMGRYTGWKNYLKLAATTIAGAVKLNDKLSVGAGATNYWAYAYGQYLNYPNANILSSPGARDGRAWLDSNGYGWGWNFGILAKPHPKHRLGFSFRSKADVDVHGQVKIDDLVSAAAQGYDSGPHFVSGAHAQLQLPQNFTWAYAYVPSDKWAVEFDFGLTGWGILKELDYDFDRNNSTLRGLGTIPRDYDDTFSLNLGGHYRLNEKTDFQTGFFFYQAASPKKHVDNYLPDTHRYGWSLGTSYQITQWLRTDLTYLFILYATRHISNPQIPAKGGDNIDGRYTSILHGAFISFNVEFDFPFENRHEKEKEAAPKIDTSKAIITR